MNPKKEIKEIVRNKVKGAVSGLCGEAAKGTEEITDFLKEIMEHTEDVPLDFDIQPAIGPRANFFYQLKGIKPTLSTLLKECTPEVTDGNVFDFNAIDLQQQELVRLGLSNYLAKGIKISVAICKALKYSYMCIIAIVGLFYFCQVYRSGNRVKEVTKRIIPIGVGLFLTWIGSKLGALIGATGGSIGIIVGPILGVMIGGLIGAYCGRGMLKIVRMIFFPKSAGGQGQPSIEGTKLIYGQPCIQGAETVMEQTEIHGLLPKGQPKIAGAEAAIGLPKLW